MPWPMPPGTQPRIPMPAIPEHWKAAGALLQLLPWITSRVAEGRGATEDEAATGARNPAFQRQPPAAAPPSGALSAPPGNQMESRKSRDDEDHDEDEMDSDEMLKRYWQGVKARARARERGKAVSAKPTSGGYDPRNYCSDRHEAEQKRCNERYPEYANRHFLRGCETRAEDRRSKCIANGGIPDPTEPAEWDLDPDEELYRNLDR
jgi:hypothetical protein